jgi:hypothetical protein
MIIAPFVAAAHEAMNKLALWEYNLAHGIVQTNIAFHLKSGLYGYDCMAVLESEP